MSFSTYVGKKGQIFFAEVNFLRAENKRLACIFSPALKFRKHNYFVLFQKRLVGNFLACHFPTWKENFCARNLARTNITSTYCYVNFPAHMIRKVESQFGWFSKRKKRTLCLEMIKSICFQHPDLSAGTKSASKSQLRIWIFLNT